MASNNQYDRYAPQSFDIGPESASGRQESAA
jgi:hypothetical protein